MTVIERLANVVLAKMNELNIAHRTYAHVAVPTVDEQRAALGSLPGVLTKNLLLKDKKAGTFLGHGRRGPARGHEEAAHVVRY